MEADLITQLQNLNLKNYKLLSIDVGILNLGFAGIEFNSDFEFQRIIGMELIDITKFHHRDGYNLENCPLHHSRTASDWLDHIFWTYSEIFDSVDLILIERQPPMGLVAIEQLIFSQYREKCILINPRQMHKHFCIQGYNYERRKIATTEFAKTFIDTVELANHFDTYKRQHDIADGICQAIYFLDKHATKKSLQGLKQYIYKQTRPRYVPI